MIFEIEFKQKKKKTIEWMDRWSIRREINELIITTEKV